MLNNLKKYLLRGAPAYLIPLGAGFVMASSSDIRAALGMGLAVLVIMLLSSIEISAIRNFIPQRFHLPIYVLIVTGFTTLVHMLMEAFMPEVVNMLGVHLAALAVSAVPYRESEEIASVNGEKKTILSALLTGAFFTILMVVCALFREVLGNGSFFGIEIPFLANYKVSALAGAFGGYLVLAIVCAVINKLGEKCVEKEAE
jgi:electron transport complex protein RnfE